nr:cytosolic sulfotransferase 12-like [Ipomoea batatas]
MAAPSDDSNISNTFENQFLQEDSYPEELRELMDSLPKEKGWITPDMYNYKGFWLGSIHLQGVLRCQKHFQAQDYDIMLCSLQKTGTTWLKSLLFALITRKQYFPAAISQQQIHPLLTKNPHELIPGIEFYYAIENSPDFPMNNGRRILSTHLPGALLPKSILQGRISVWAFLGSYVGLWKDSLENRSKVLFLKYEEIKEEPDVHLKRIAAFLDCPFSEEEEECGVVDGILRLCSFESLSNLEVNKTGKTIFRQTGNHAFFRKGKVGDWRNHMSDEMASRLDQIVDEKFKGTGLNL